MIARGRGLSSNQSEVPNETVPREWNPRIISELLNDLVVIRDMRRKTSLLSRSAIEVSKVTTTTATEAGKIS